MPLRLLVEARLDVLFFLHEEGCGGREREERSHGGGGTVVLRVEGQWGDKARRLMICREKGFQLLLTEESNVLLDFSSRVFGFAAERSSSTDHVEGGCETDVLLTTDAESGSSGWGDGTSGCGLAALIQPGLLESGEGDGEAQFWFRFRSGVEEALSVPCKREEGDDGGLHLTLGDEQGEVERVGEDIVVDEVGEEGDQLEEGVSGFEGCA